MLKNKFDNREAELKLLMAFSKQFLNTDDLHFGYWTDDLDVSVANFPQAQENHSQFVIAHIPADTKTVLDVGMGMGKMSDRLRRLGYEVEGVSPSSFLTEEARKLLGEDFRIYELPIEDMETDKRYDLVLFSESFQYVDMERALATVNHLLNDNGHLLICDFFQAEAEGQSPLKAGPKLTSFYRLIRQFPFKEVENIDITKETAPTMDFSNDIQQNFVKPLYEIILGKFESKLPRLYKLFRWKFKKKLDKLEWRYFSNSGDGKAFRKFKSYRLLLYRKIVS